MINKTEEREPPNPALSVEPFPLNLSDQSFSPGSEVVEVQGSRGRRSWSELTLHPEGHPQAKALNPLLQKVWNTRNRPSWIIARVILYELGMSVPEFCKLGFIEKPATLHHLFRPISKKVLREGHADRALAALLKGWKTLSEPAKNTPLGVALKEASEKVLDVALKQEISPLSKLLRSWRLRAYDEFDSSWGKEFHAFRKSGRGRFLSLSFNELIKVAKGAGLIPVDLTGKKLWNHPVTKEARKSFLAEAETRLAASSATTLVMMLELAGYGTSAESLRGDADFKSAGLTWNAARDLARFDAISSEAAKPILDTFRRRKLFPAKDIRALETALQEQYAASLPESSFSKSITAEFQGLGITNSEIAEALRVPKPKNTTLSPADCVRHSISGSGYQHECPAGVLALLAAGTETRFRDLLAARRAEISRELGLRRGTHEPHPLVIERLLWGVDFEQISVERSLLENTEWRRRGTRLTREQEQAVFEQISQIGMSRGREALLSLIKHLQPGSTAKTIERLSSLAGGITGISRAGQVGMARAERFISGQEIPPLPILKDIVRSLNIVANPTVLRRWYLDFADQQNMLQSTPAARMLVVDVLSRFRDIGTFIKSLDAGQRAGLSLRKFLKGVDFSSEDLSSLLTAIGIESSSDRYAILMASHRELDGVQGVRAWLAGLPPEVQRRWIRAIGDLAAAVRVDLQSPTGQVSPENTSLRELLFLKGGGRFSCDLALPPSLRVLEPNALTTISSLAGLTAKEVIALADSFVEKQSDTTRPTVVVQYEKLWDRLFDLGLTPRRLAPVLVEVLVKSGEQSKTGLLTSIERTLDARRFSAMTPYAVVAALVAKNAINFAEMLDAERKRLKANSDGRLSRGEIEAKLWGVHPKVLFEIGIEVSDEKAVKTAQTLGLRMCGEVLKELVADREQGLSRRLLKTCMYRVGMMGFDFSQAAGVKSAALLGFMRGQRALDWVRYAKLVEFSEVPAKSLVKLWWQLDLAETLRHDPKRLTDRQRVGAALRAEGNGHLTYFIDEHTAESEVRQFRRALPALESGQYSDSQLEVVLKLMKVAPSSARGVFLKRVFQTGSIQQGIHEIAIAASSKQRPNSVGISDSALTAFTDFLQREVELEQGLNLQTPEVASLIAYLSYANKPVSSQSTSKQHISVLDVFCEAFPGATREELRSVLRQCYPERGRGLGGNSRLRKQVSNRGKSSDNGEDSDQTEVLPRVLHGVDARSWQACLTELNRWPRENFDSIQIFEDKQQVVADGQLVPLTVLCDALFGINHDTVSEERVEVMWIRVRLGMSATHPGDQRVVFSNPRASLGNYSRTDPEFDDD